MIRKRPLCRHCHKHAVNRPRGLCWPCWYIPGVRALYPSTSKYANRRQGEPLDAESDGTRLNHDAADIGYSWYVVATDSTGRRAILSGHPCKQDAAAEARQLAAGGVDYVQISVERHGQAPALRLEPTKAR
jgi:hypothetical protein